MLLEPSRGSKAFDPLDGSSNIDYSVSIGTIFSVFPRKSQGEKAGPEDILRPGNEIVAAGYIVYGSSTVLVYSSGQSVDCFTLDPSSGEFFLTRADVKIPENTTVLSINECNEPYWPIGLITFINGQHRRVFRNLHVRSGQEEFSRRWIEGEAIYGLTRAIHKNRR